MTNYKTITLLLTVLFIAACTSPAQVGQGIFDEELSQATFQNGLLNYNLTFQKPTPCHALVVDERYENGVLTVDVTLDYTAETGEVCSQVVEYENIVGEYDDEELSQLRVILDGAEVYTQDL